MDHRSRPAAARRLAERFTGVDAHDLTELSSDLDPFAFLLGKDDAEQLVGNDEPMT